MTQQQSNNGVHTSIDRIAVKVPVFNKSDPELWFAILERSFSISGIVADDTMYNYAVQGLDVDAQFEVRDLVINPPSSNRYLTLKTELVKRLVKTQEQRQKQLLEREELGDSKPSQFLRRLRNLSGPAVSDDLLKTLWLGRLPRPMQRILVTRKKIPLDEIAELADAIAEAEYPLRTIASTSQSFPVDELQKELAALRVEVTELRSNLRSTSKKRNRSLTPSRRDNSICWYHRRFAAKAKKCTQPCTFSSGNATGSC